MRNHNKIYLIVLLALPVVMFTSCKKFLYEAPKNATYGAKYWTDLTAVEQASNSMYTQLRSALRMDRSHFVFGDFTTGSFSANTSAEWNLIRSPQFNFSYVPYLEGSLKNWTRFYRIIAQANLILENVPAMPANVFPSEEVRKKYIADALFMRAYCYFYMIRVWGDPVYVSKTYNDVDYGKIPPIARSSETDVLDSCIRDVKIAAGYQSFGGGNPEMSVKANKGSSYALLAHMYAWKHDYDNTNFYCNEIINNGGYSLEPISTYKNIWAGKQSNESIFEIPMQLVGEWEFGFFATFLKGTAVDNRKSTCWLVVDGNTIDDFFNRSADLRYNLIFLQMPASGGDAKGAMLTKYSNFEYQKPESKLNPYVANNLVLFRLSDIYLLNAEALASKNDLGSARNNLKMTEERAGINTYTIPTSKDQMLDSILAERGRELIGEGQWFYDMIRTNATQHWLENKIGYLPERISPMNKGYYWPLDMSQLFPQNSLLTQNPWWAKHSN
jgi:starch-binding outer membrane protein, SusD/RagB family